MEHHHLGRSGFKVSEIAYSKLTVDHTCYRRCMRLLLAARLSKPRTGQTGLDTQDQDARQWAVSRGHTVIGVAADRAGSRVPPWERRNLKPWMTDPDKIAQYDGIVAAKQDRLSRAKWRDEAAIRIWAEDHGKELFIVSPEMHWPAKDMAEGLTWDVLARQAAEEWKNTSDRYKRAMKYLRENGYLGGKVPFGFRPVEVENSERKVIEPDWDNTAPYVVKMAERYLEGETLAEICAWLDSEGVRTSHGRRWQQSSLATLLRNPVLIGQMESRGKIVRDKDGQPVQRCKPILKRETWDRLQAKLNAAPRLGSTVSGDTALLTNVLFCGKCQGPMYKKKAGYTSNGKTYVNFYYRCHGQRHEGKFVPSTCRYSVRMDDAEQAVNDAVMAFSDLPHREKRVTPGDDNTLRMAEISNALAELAQEYGTMPREEYRSKRTILEDEYDRLASAPSRARQEEWVYDGRTLGEVWEAWDTRHRRSYLLEHGWRFVYLGRAEDGTPIIGGRAPIWRPTSAGCPA